MYSIFQSKNYGFMNRCFCDLLLLVALVVVSGLAPANAQGTRSVARTESTQNAGPLNFKKSYALLIGASDYEDPAWQDLPSIPRELDRLQETLELYGFDVKREENPPSGALSSIIEKFLRDYGYDPDNRLFVWFSGHGTTLDDPEGRPVGYILPVDVPNPDEDKYKFMSKALSMVRLNNYANELSCRHALFVFDSCFSGSIFTSRSATPKIHPYDWSRWNKNVRQFMSAGGANEEVPGVSEFAPPADMN